MLVNPLSVVRLECSFHFSFTLFICTLFFYFSFDDLGGFVLLSVSSSHAVLSSPCKPLLSQLGTWDFLLSVLTTAHMCPVLRALSFCLKRVQN